MGPTHHKPLAQTTISPYMKCTVQRRHRLIISIQNEYPAVYDIPKSSFPDTQELSPVKSSPMSTEAWTNCSFLHLLCPVSQQYCCPNINQRKQHSVLETCLNSWREKTTSQKKKKKKPNVVDEVLLEDILWIGRTTPRRGRDTLPPTVPNTFQRA